MDVEAENEQQDSQNGLGWGWLCWLPVTLLLYILSLGPVLMTLEKAHITTGGSRKVILGFYQPLIWTVQKMPQLDKPLGMYMHLWLPEHFDSKGNEVHR